MREKGMTGTEKQEKVRIKWEAFELQREECVVRDECRKGSRDRIM